MRMRVFSKRIVTVIISIVMVLTTVPVEAFATQVNDEIDMQNDDFDSLMGSNTEIVSEDEIAEQGEIAEEISDIEAAVPNSEDDLQNEPANAVSENKPEQAVEDEITGESLIADYEEKANEQKLGASVEKRTVMIDLVNKGEIINESQGWSYYGTTKTLSLENVNLDIEDDYAIKVDDDLNIEVVGDCYISGGLGGIECIGDGAHINICVPKGETGTLKIVQKNSTVPDGKTSACIFANAEGVSLNINAPTTFVSKGVGSYTAYNLEEITNATSTEVIAHGDGFYNSNCKDKGSLTIKQGSKTEICAAGYAVYMKSLNLMEGSTLYLNEWEEQSKQSANAAVFVEDFHSQDSAKLDNWYLNRTVLQVENSFEATGGSTVHAFTHNAQDGTAAIVYNGESTLKIYNGSKVEAASNSGDGLLINKADLEITMGGCYNMLSPTGNNDYYGLHLRGGDINLSTSGTIKTSSYSETELYKYGNGILMDQYAPGKENTGEIEDGSIYIGEGGKIELYTYNDAMYIEGMGILCIDGGIADVTSKNSYGIRMSYSGTSQISLKNGAKLDICLEESGWSAISGSTGISVEDESIVNVSVLSGASISIDRLDINGENAKCSFENDGAGTILYASELNVSDGAELDCVGGLEIYKSLDVTKDASVRVQCAATCNEVAALILSNCTAKISDGGTVEVVQPENVSFVDNCLLRMNNSNVIINGEKSALTLQNTNSNVMKTAVMGIDSSITINEGLMDCNIAGELLSAYSSGNDFSDVDLFIQNDGKLNVKSLATTGNIIDGNGRIYIDNANLLIEKAKENTDETISDKTKVSVTNSSIVTPQMGVVSEGRLFNKDNEPIVGDIEIATNKEQGMYILTQPGKEYKGKSGEGLSTHVQVKVINGNYDDVKYQWYYAERTPGSDKRNARLIEGATAATLVFPNEVGIRDYFCEIVLGNLKLETDYSRVMLEPAQSSGRKVITDTILIKDDTLSVTNTEEGWSWDKDSRRLILDNAVFDIKKGNAIRIITEQKEKTVIEVRGQCIISDKSEDYAIYNVIADAITYEQREALKNNAQMIFEGDGNLEIYSDNSGIYSCVNLQVHVPVDIESGNGIALYGEGCLMSDSPISATSKTNWAMYLHKDVSIAADVYVRSSSSYSLYSSGNIDIKDSTLKLEALKYSYGLYSSGTVSICNSNIDIYSEYYYGVYANKELVIYDSELRIDMRYTSGYAIYAKEGRISESQVYITGDSQYGIYYYELSKDAIIEDSEVEINVPKANTGFNAYGRECKLLVKNSDFDIISNSKGVYLSNQSFRLENSICNIETKSINESYYNPAVDVAKECSIVGGSKLNVKGASPGCYVLKVSKKLMVAESSLKVSKPDDNSISAIYCYDGYETMGTIISSPEGAYFDENSRTIKTANDECPNEIECIPDPEPYVAIDKITVSENNKPTDEMLPIVSQNSKATMTVGYRVPNGKPTDMQISWYRYDFHERHYEHIEGENSEIVSISTEKIGRVLYKAEIKYGNKVLFIEQTADVIPSNVEPTLVDEGEYRKAFEAYKSEDCMSTHGWAWDGERYELTLANAYFIAPVYVPKGTKIILLEGTESYIRDSNYCIQSTYSSNDDFLGIYGAGSLKLDTAYDDYYGNGIEGFKNVYIGPEVELSIMLQGYGYGISTSNNGNISVNYADVEIDGQEGANVTYGKIITVGCDIKAPSECYYDNFNMLYTDSECQTACNYLKIEKTKQQYISLTREPETALFMNKNSVTPIVANIEAFNLASGDRLNIEWYRVSDWYKANSQKISDGVSFVPDNEIGEQLYYFKAFTESGEISSYESDVFAVYVMPEGRKPLISGLDLYSGIDSTQEEYDLYGYRWDDENKILTLDSAFIYCRNGGVSIPYGSTVNVTGGSVNVIRSEKGSPLSLGGTSTKSFTMSGEGTLFLENVNKDYTYNVFLFQDLNEGLFFKNGIDVTFCTSRSGGSIAMQVYDGFIADNATVNIVTGECKTAINKYSGTNNDTNGIVLRNSAKLSIDCFGQAYNGYGNVLTVDETSQMNVLCKAYSEGSNQTYSYYGLGYHNVGNVLIDGKVSIAVETTDKGMYENIGTLYANNLTIGEKGELTCRCLGADCTMPVVFINGITTLDGKMSVFSASPNNAIRVNSGTFNVNAGANLLLENRSNTPKELTQATLAVVTGKMNVFGDVEIYNHGEGPALVVNDNSYYNQKYFTTGDEVSFLPEVDFVKYSYKPNSYYLYRWIVCEKQPEGAAGEERKEVSSLRIIGGEEPEQLVDVEISGIAKVGEKLMVSTVEPQDATVYYEWQYSDAPDGTFNSIYNTSDSYIPGKYYIGKYFRVKATGKGKYIGTVYSDVIGPVEGGGTDIKSVSIDREQYSFGTGLRLYKSVDYVTDNVFIEVEPYDKKSKVSINGNDGNVYTTDSLSYGTNYVTIVVSDSKDSETYTIEINKQTPPKYTLKFGENCIVPNGYVLTITKNDQTGKIQIPTAAGATPLNIYKDETYTVSYEGNNELYGIWAIKRNGTIYPFNNHDSLVIRAGTEETISVDADCYYVKAPENLKADWNPNGRDSVIVSWELPNGTYPTALSENYGYNLVKIECIDSESGEEINQVTQKSTSDTNCEFTGLDDEKSYDFVAYFANDTGKRYVPYNLPQSLINYTKATVTVGKCPSGYELKVLDYDTEKEVKYCAIKGYTEGETPECVKLLTNLPQGIRLEEAELSCENSELLNVSVSDGIVTLSPQMNMTGSTYVTFKPTIYGKHTALQLRVDVFSDEPSMPQVTKTSLSTNIYCDSITDEATQRIFFATADKITDVTWADETLNKYFTCEIQDDRTFVVLPNQEYDFADTANTSEIKKIKGSYKSAFIVKSVKNPEGEKTGLVTLKVTKKLPTVKVSAVKLNTFFEDVSLPLSISCAQGDIEKIEIDESKTTAKVKACPDWMSFDEDDWSVTVPNVGGKYSGKLYLKAYVKEYNAPVACTVSVSASRSVPKVKLSATKITLPRYKGYMANPVQLSLVSTDKKVSVESLNFTDIRIANEGDLGLLPEKTRKQYMSCLSYKVESFDEKTGEFTIVPSGRSENLTGGKLLLYAYVGGKRNQKVEFNLTVANSEKVTIKPSVSTLKINLAAGIGTGNFKIIPSAAGYDMGTFTYVGCEKDSLKMVIKDAKGKVVCNDSLGITYNESSGVVSVNSNEKTLPGSYKLYVTDRDGATCNLTVKTTATLPKYKANISTVTLNKKFGNDSSEIAIKADKYANTQCSVAVCDAKGNIITENVPLAISWTSFEKGGPGTIDSMPNQTEWGWKIKLNEYAEYGKTYKLMVTYKLKDYNVTIKPMYIMVKVASEKVQPSVKLKLTGAIDPARLNSRIIVKPSYTNITKDSIWDINQEEDAKPILVVTAMRGKKIAEGDYIGENGNVSEWFDYRYNYETGEIEIFENAESDMYRNSAFDATLTFNAKLLIPNVTVIKNNAEAIYETAAFKLPVKQNKIVITASNNNKSSLCKDDKNDRSYVIFKIDDLSVSDVKSARIYTKNGAVSNFTLNEIGNGMYSLGFTNAEVSQKIKAETLTINFRFEGCGADSKATSVKIKVDLQKAN